MDHEIVPVAYSPVGRVGDVRGTGDIIDSDLVISLAEKYSKSPVQIVLNWGLCRGYAVIPFSSNVEHQAQNLQSMEFRMEEADVQSITERFDDGTVLFKAPEETNYNLFV